MKYTKVTLNNGHWVYTEVGHDYLRPSKWVTFAFDTETLVFFKGKVMKPNQLFKKVKNLNNNEKRKFLNNVTWAWQIYDEVNGFFMTNDFYEFLAYQCRCGFKFGWCYNSTFDFAQIDYEVLGKGLNKWTPHEHTKTITYEEYEKLLNDNEIEFYDPNMNKLQNYYNYKSFYKTAYNKGQPWTYESIHNDQGARYAYKLWVPYRHFDRHTYVHAVEYRDFMKLITGGLRKMLEDLKVTDNDGNPLRKLTMDYQAVDPNNLKDDEVDYCAIDVKGLYFGIKLFNSTIEEQSNNELHIFGEDTNIMTAGGFAKHELLRSLYPNLNTNKKRIKQFQKEHPITEEQDKYVRDNHLYRGGIAFVNEYFKGKLIVTFRPPMNLKYIKEMGAMIMKETMKRFDVNSEYPYAMSIINDLIGKPIIKTMEEYENMPNKDDYEAIYILSSVFGDVKQNYIGFWYDPFKKEFVEHINEHGTHLMFERELIEMSYWYDDFEYKAEKVILMKKGEKVYAKFVNENYALKAEAKKQGNKTLQQATKLKLNSSYGKLSERLERINGHYELNEETGAIHFVRDGVEVETSSCMNVIIGSLITSVARCYILSKIREICGHDIKHTFVYIDTDSIHAYVKGYDKADAYKLGGLKLEATCEAVKYIAPKTYIDIERVNNDLTIDYNAFEIHSKGINLQAVINDLKKKQKGKKHNLPTLELINRKINYGAKYICLVAMNVQGGKVLIPTEKYLARLELAPNEDDQVALTNYGGAMFIER